MIEPKQLTACKSQLIFPDFLTRYEEELTSLHKNPGFLYEMAEARGTVSPEVEFCTDNSNIALRRFKDSISQHIYESKAYYDYPDFKAIVDDVQLQGIKSRGTEYTKRSACISVYYALRYLKLCERINSGR